MQIRLGYELVYDCPQPTPMLLMLNVHYTRVSDLVEPDHLVTTPAVPIRGYRDGFGNWCSRIVAPAGQTRLTTNAIIKDTGEPDVIAVDAPQHTLPDLPDDALVFLLGSRYCETDRLADVAWSLFGKTPLGWGRVQAICDFVHQHIVFGYEHARASRTAWEAYCDRTGVCRDFAHLAAGIGRCDTRAPSDVDTLRLQIVDRAVHVLDFERDHAVAEMLRLRRGIDLSAIIGDQLDRRAAELEIDEVDRHAEAGALNAVALADREAEDFGVERDGLIRLVGDDLDMVNTLEDHFQLTMPSGGCCRHHRS